MDTKKTRGFTLIELLVVVAVIALLMAVIIPALGKAKIYAQKVICKNDVRQQCLGIILYSNDNDSATPNFRGGAGGWMWDVSFHATNQLSEYAGFDENETFFCPANKDKKASDARFWQYQWLYSGTSPAGTMPFPQEVAIMDESVLNDAQLKSNYRVLPIVYLLDRLNNSGDSIMPQTLETGEPANWIRKLSNVKASGSKTMVMDAVISANSWQFTEITAGGIDELSGGMLRDSTNHLKRQTIGTPPNAGPAPEGSNVGYADGHVDWRDFEDMRHRRTTGGMRFWW